MLLLLLLFALQFGKTQLFIAERILNSLNQKNNVSIELKAFKISPIGNFYIKDVLIRDHCKDTLIYVNDIKGSLDHLKGIQNNKLSFRNVKVTNGWLRDCLYKGEDKSNLTFFANSFKSAKKKKKKPFQLEFENLKLTNLRYFNIRKEKPVVDFNHISGVVHRLSIKGADVSVATDSLSLKDIYGIEYKKLSTDFTYTFSKMCFNNTHLITPKSEIFCDVVFKANNKSYAHFVDNVNLSGKVYQSKVSLEDVKKIYPYIEGKQVLNLTSNVSGTLNHLKLNKTEIIAKDHSAYFVGDFIVKNSIHKREEFWFQAKNASIETHTNKLKSFVPTLYYNALPNNFYGLSQVNYIGDLFVSREKLVLAGEAITNLGSINVNGFIKEINTPKKELEFEILKGFIPDNPVVKELKKIAFKGKVKGTIEDKKLDLTTKFDFKEINYKKNKIKNSVLELNFKDNELLSRLKVNDSLLSLVADINYKKKRNNKEFDLDFKIKKARISKLFPEYVSFQKNIIADGKLSLQKTNDSLVSIGALKKLRIDTESESLKLNDVDLFLFAKEKEKKIKLNSKDLLSLEVNGDFEFEDLEKLVVNALYKFIPSSKSRTEVKPQTLNFDLKVSPKLAKSFTNKIELKDYLSVSGVLDSNGDKGIIKAVLPAFSSKDMQVDSLKVVLDNSNQWLNSNISIDKFKFKKQQYENLSLLGKKVNDTLFVRSNFNSDKIENRAIFYLTAEKNAVYLGIENVYLKYLNSIWTNKAKSKNKVYYNYKNKEWYFYGLSFANRDQEFDFDGSIKKDKSKNLRLTLKNVHLEEVLPGVDSLKIGGQASGKVFFNEKNNLLRPNGDLFVKNLKINGIGYGNLATSLKPNKKKLGYNVNFRIVKDDIQNINAKGSFLLNKENFLASTIKLNVLLKDLQLKSLGPLGRNVLSSIRGKAAGEFLVTGRLDDFNTNGEINLKNAGLKFPYLNTDYNFVGNTKVVLKGKKFLFGNVDLEDRIFKTKGTLTGEINYDKYNNWKLNLNVNAENLVALNTKQEETSKYYGTAFIKGNATIIGPTSNLAINVTGTTLPQTTFVLPISDVKETENNKFIFYKEIYDDQEGEEFDEAEVVTESGVSVNLDLEVTKDAFAEVVIDQTTGSSLQARADGRLNISIDKFYNISMYGDLEVDEGMYIYKYGGIVNKPFVVNQGGTVSWDGDPYKAELDIVAVHSVKANPKVLLENLSVNRKIDVDLITKVTGELFDSSQEFFVEIPNASSTVKSELDFIMNSDENSKMRQFFSLLVTKSFYDENSVGNTSSVLSSTTSDIISNAITQIFNNDDSKLQVNIGYTAGQSTDIDNLEVDNQLDIGVATEINDRILINGKLGVPVGAKTQSAVIGEVKVEFLINKDGTLRSSVFNRQNEIQYSQDDQGYTQGIGLNYQIDFNNLREMLKKIGLIDEKKKKKTKEKKAATTNERNSR